MHVKLLKKSLARLTLPAWLTGLAVIGITALPLPANAFGIAPATIEIKNFLRGSQQTQIIYLLKTPDDKGESFYVKAETVSVDGKSISGPISVFMPADQDSVPYPITITTSQVSNGAYQGAIFFSKQSTPATTSTAGNAANQNIGSGAAVISRLQLGVYYTVTGEEQVAYRFHDLQAQDTETELPVYLRYVMDNLGNVSWRPYGLLLSIQNVNNPTENIFLDVNGTSLPLIAPGQDGIVLIEKTIPLNAGKYVAKLQFYDQQHDTLAELTSNQFNVFPPNTLSQKGELISYTSNKQSYAPTENIKVSASFKNTGKVPAHAVLITEVFGSNNELIDVERSKEALVSVGETAGLDQVFSLAQSNQYQFVGHIEYGLKKTGSKTLAITVAPTALTIVTTTYSWLYWLLYLIPLLLILILIYEWYKNRPKKKYPEEKRYPQDKK